MLYISNSRCRSYTGKRGNAFGIYHLGEDLLLVAYKDDRDLYFRATEKVHLYQQTTLALSRKFGVGEGDIRYIDPYRAREMLNAQE